MIIITGGAGFIGSATVWKLNQTGRNDIVIVDELGDGEKWKNLNGLSYADIYHKADFLDMVLDNEVPFKPEAIIHLGACSSTTEKDADYLLHNNFVYTVELAKYALERDIRFIYASSAATYGSGEFGYDDNEDELEKLRPLNMYGYSKQMFDLWAKQNKVLDRIVGLKYFNVYGPNEFHKGDMRSVVHKSFEQIRDTGKVKLFKSTDSKYKDGGQMRDFIYVKDAVDMTLFFLDIPGINGLYNIGTGKARTWNDLVTAVFKAVGKPINIEYIDMPQQLIGKYQNFTEAKMNKIKEAGYKKEITSLEKGVDDYVKNYLLKNEFLAW
ncbi:adp-l-glycero-d-manno-heptose-6-epimerase [hydrocarbon metagenome]|uniref:Adp-l-glycero-d-manno-heptose-6-epimerase n=1 Tax=hydrocarbon metagenome TaxID=938273 RepID=A0A0W8FVJ5_9ZZZZ